MKRNTRKITIGGQELSPDDLQENKMLQAQMVPENWPGRASECVRLYLSTAEMLSLQLRRHLAANWKRICKTAQEEAGEGDKARVKLAFNFELDHTAPSVVAITALGMGYSIKVSTKGRPMTHDLNQGDFLEDLGQAMDIAAFEAENAAPPEPEEPAEGEQAPPTDGGDKQEPAAAAERAGKGRKKK